MGRDCSKASGNVYFEARKAAAEYDDRLYSREKAAELLGVSVSTLADYENGNTKFVPVDKVVLMADLYHQPELKTGYCKHECPIGDGGPRKRKNAKLLRFREKKAGKNCKSASTKPPSQQSPSEKLPQRLFSASLTLTATAICTQP